MPFFAPEEHRDGGLLLRAWRPGDGEELNRATVASFEHLRRFMEWPSRDATVDWADADWSFHKLTWHCESGNLASARVAEKCGFQLEGRLRENGPTAIPWWSAGPTPAARST